MEWNVQQSSSWEYYVAYCNTGVGLTWSGDIFMPGKHTRVTKCTSRSFTKMSVLKAAGFWDDVQYFNVIVTCVTYLKVKYNIREKAFKYEPVNMSWNNRAYIKNMPLLLEMIPHKASQALRPSLIYCASPYLLYRTSWPKGQHFCFVFGRSWVQISARRLALPTEVCCGFPQSLQETSGIVH
jgi:hypothetical protein